MRKRADYLWILLFFSLLGCVDKQEDKKPPITHKFSFIVNENYIEEDERKWVLIYDEKMSLVAEAELGNSNGIELKWNIEENDALYTVQIVSASFEDNDEVFEIQSYTQIEPEIWYLNGWEAQMPGQVLGKNEIVFTDFNISDFDYHWVSNLGSGGSILYNNSITISQYHNPDKLWMCFYNENETPYYKFIENVSISEDMSISMNQLTPMENYIEYQIPISSYSDVLLRTDVTTDDAKMRYTVYSLQKYESSNSIRVYYPGSLFSKYYLSLYFHSEDNTESMEFYGADLPTTFVRLDIDEVINKVNIHDFESSITGGADYMVHFWENATYDNQNGNRLFRYYVYSPVQSGFTYHAPPIPDYISVLNSELLDFNKLNLEYTNFVKIDNSNNYTGFINSQFAEPEVSNDYSLKLLKQIFRNKNRKK